MYCESFSNSHVKDTATILELPSVSTPSHGAIRQFQLSLNDVTVQLSSLGASITSVLLPNYSLSATGGAPQVDDVVLSYKSSREQLEHKNTQFLGAIVGRVANRIKGGTFQLKQDDLSSDKLSTYTLDLNDGNINHLHGGYDGLWNRIWDAEMDETKSNSL